MTRKTGTLYVVATPIGNLSDISQRAMNTLNEVGLILAEDTRHAAKILKHFAISTPTRALHEYNEDKQVAWICQQLQDGLDIALISDAGTPLISDPGYRLIHILRQQEISVSPIPGTCALVAALSCSGLPTDSFVFIGFLSAKKIKRVSQLKGLIYMPRTLIFYESSHRILASLHDMSECFEPTRQAVVAREMTKKFETFYTGSFNVLLEALSAGGVHQKGEFVILVAPSKEQNLQWVKACQLVASLVEYLPAKVACKISAQTFNENKNELYAWMLENTE